jgi:hypothetical protein
MTFNDHVATLIHAELGSHAGEEKKAARWSLSLPKDETNIKAWWSRTVVDELMKS